jgi:hypothetical protein
MRTTTVNVPINVKKRYTESNRKRTRIAAIV